MKFRKTHRMISCMTSAALDESVRFARPHMVGVAQTIQHDSEGIHVNEREWPG